VVLRVLTLQIEGQEPLLKFAYHVNCDRSDNFISLWKKVLSQITTTYAGTGFGRQEVRVEGESLADRLNEKSSPGDVLALLRALPKSVVILDEFDTLTEKNTTGLIADCIKTLSDFEVDCTIVIVGVADSVSQLIAEHASVERSLTQIHMPRLIPRELEDITRTRYPKAGMTFDSDVPAGIARLSQGFPHYTHRLGLNSGRAALDRDSSNVVKEDIRTAIKKAVRDTAASTREKYITAIQSSHKESLHKQVLLACALAKPDEFGYFRPPDVREPMSLIMGKKYDTPAFARHLSDFCDEWRGKVLERKGKKNQYAYRFSNPLLRPYVYLRGIDSGMVPKEHQPL
jgi:Cdc6-like AAA superfamily ATPase